MYTVWIVMSVSPHVHWVSLTCSPNVILLHVAHCLSKQINRQTENRMVRVSIFKAD